MSKAKDKFQSKVREVSVIIPFFNSHDYLEDALSSLIKQTVPPSEVIIVNDGSTHLKSLALLGRLEKHNYIIIHSKNQGLPSARNLGIQHANSELILPLDSDDWLEPHCIESHLDTLYSTSGNSFSYSQIILQGEKTGLLEKKFNQFEQLFFNQLPYSIMYKKSHWLSVGGYDENMKLGYEDWDFNLRLLFSGVDAYCTTSPSFNYRVAKSGMLLSRSRKFHGSIWHYIISKNSERYKIFELFKLWIKCRKSPSTKPLFLYFGWFMLFKMLPIPWTNFLFSKLKFLSHSNKKKFQIRQ